MPDKILVTLVRVMAALHGGPVILERKVFHHGSHTMGTPRSSAASVGGESDL